MKIEYLEILDQVLKSHKHKEAILAYASELVNFYEEKRDTSKTKFRQLLEKYNFETIVNFSEYPEYPHVTLFHGSGSLEFCPVIDYEGGVSEMDNEIGIIIPESNIYTDEIRFDSPIYEELDGWSHRVLHDIVFIYLCTIWQDVKGYNYGIIVKTLENNSVRQFMFNDLSWQDLSEFGFYKDKNTRVSPYFKRDLSVFEIYQRINFDTYPFNPYENRWRIFKKENTTIEIAGWGNEIGERINDGELLISEKKDLKSRLTWEKRKSDELLNNDFQEKFYVKRKEQLHKEAIEFSFHSGIHWYSDEMNSRLNVELINRLESKLGLSFPFHFKQYLKLLNGRKFNTYRAKFHANEKEVVQVKEFYNIEEIEHFNAESKNLLQKILTNNKRKIEWLKIGLTSDGEDLLLGVNKDSNFGKLKLEKDKLHIKDISLEFSEFIKHARH